jgi:hypothetical protein
MPTVPEFLRHDLHPGLPATIVLRSGFQISGPLEQVDLVAGILHVDGWALRVDEIAAARAGQPATAPRAA